MFCQAMIKVKRRKQKSARATLEKTKMFGCLNYTFKWNASNLGDAGLHGPRPLNDIANRIIKKETMI